jgi:hypothetical protein
MKKKKTVTLALCGRGWTLWSDSETPFVGTLDEAVAQIAPGTAIHLALPAQALVFERLRLPATEADELNGMVRLQWEKALPVPIDEVTGDFLVLERTPTDSVVLTVAAFQSSLEKLCEPLLQRRLVPAQVTAYVEHVATDCKEGGTLLVLYAEYGSLVAAVIEDRRPGWVHVIPELDAERLAAELPQLLLTAGLSGVPTNFNQVFVAPELLALKPLLKQFFEAPMTTFAPPKPPFAGSLNLLPSGWSAQSGQHRRSRDLRQRLTAAALVYVVLAIAAGAYLYSLRSQMSKLDREVAQLQPQLMAEQAQQARSIALGPAIDPHHFAVELLYLLQKEIPAESVRLTEFDESQGQWRVVGEAPTVQLATDFAARVKKDPDLAAWSINNPPPQLVGAEHWQFNIFGKL